MRSLRREGSARSGYRGVFRGDAVRSPDDAAAAWLAQREVLRERVAREVQAMVKDLTARIESLRHEQEHIDIQIAEYQELIIDLLPSEKP